MSEDKGKYDDLCEKIHKDLKSEATLLIVLKRNQNSGFSIVAHKELMFQVPELLKNIAEDIEIQIGQEVVQILLKKYSLTSEQLSEHVFQLLISKGIIFKDQTPEGRKDILLWMKDNVKLVDESLLAIMQPKGEA